MPRARTVARGVRATRSAGSWPAARVAVDRMGRIAVERISAAGHPDAFVIGDLALRPWRDRRSLPGVAPVAMQQGRTWGNVIRAAWP